MAGKQRVVHTIGHSDLDLEKFIGLLERNQIQLIADVRSAPYSRHVPQFNRERLTGTLRHHSIGYLYLGDRLSGRPGEDLLYDQQGRANYRLMALEPESQEGVRQLAQAAGERRIALLCTERDPLKCHRALLVSPALEEAGAEVVHILGDGGRMTHEELMDRLLKMQGGLKQDGKKTTRRRMIEQAVDRQAQQAAYRRW